MQWKIGLVVLLSIFALTACSSQNEASSSNVEPDTKVETETKEEKSSSGDFEVSVPTPGEVPTVKEVQVKEFIPKINVPQVSVSASDREVNIQVPDHLFFDYDKSDLKPEAQQILDEIVKSLQQYKKAEVRIYGHTDNSGEDQYNKNLSERRAESVKAYLSTKVDLPDVTYRTKGYGESKPVAPNDTEENRQKNRRVEIIIEPK